MYLPNIIMSLLNFSRHIFLWTSGDVGNSYAQIMQKGSIPIGGFYNDHIFFLALAYEQISLDDSKVRIFFIQNYDLFNSVFFFTNCVGQAK